MLHYKSDDVFHHLFKHNYIFWPCFISRVLHLFHVRMMMSFPSLRNATMMLLALFYESYDAFISCKSDEVFAITSKCDEDVLSCNGSWG